jgi:hypothetical protein
MATPLNTASYNELNTQIQETLQKSLLPLISIYIDANATILASDTHGDILARQIMNISYTESYLDANGNPTKPFLTINFYDGTTFTDTFTTTDYVDDHWYILTSMPVPIKTF